MLQCTVGATVQCSMQQSRGGVALYIRSDLTHNGLNVEQFCVERDCELVAAIVTICTFSIIVVSCYRVPDPGAGCLIPEHLEHSSVKIKIRCFSEKSVAEFATQLQNTDWNALFGVNPEVNPFDTFMGFIQSSMELLSSKRELRRKFRNPQLKLSVGFPRNTKYYVLRL